MGRLTIGHQTERRGDKVSDNGSPKYIRLPHDLYTSSSRFINSSDYFPSHDRNLGITVRAGYHPHHNRVMVEIDEERPSFVSTSRGEYVSVDQAEDKIRERMVELADYCQKVAEELLEHSRRLRQESTLDVLDHDRLNMIQNEEEREGSDSRDPRHTSSEYVDPKHSGFMDRSRTRTHAHTKSTPRAKPAKEKKELSLNLALLT